MSIKQNLSSSENYKLQTNDEIDLFELFEILWMQKWLIVITVILSTVTGYFYTLAEENKPKIYQGKILVEIGSYINKENEIRYLHNYNDMATMLSSIDNVSAISLEKTNSLIEVIASHQDKDKITSIFGNVIMFMEQRDDLLIKKLEPEQLIKPTGIFSRGEIHEKSRKNSLIIFALSIVLGIILGVFIALLRNSLKQHNQKTLDNAN